LERSVEGEIFNLLAPFIFQFGDWLDVRRSRYALTGCSIRTRTGPVPAPRRG